MRSLALQISEQVRKKKQPVLKYVCHKSKCSPESQNPFNSKIFLVIFYNSTKCNASVRHLFSFICPAESQHKKHIREDCWHIGWCMNGAAPCP